MFFENAFLAHIGFISPPEARNSFSDGRSTKGNVFMFFCCRAQAAGAFLSNINGRRCFHRFFWRMCRKYVEIMHVLIKRGVFVFANTHECTCVPKCLHEKLLIAQLKETKTIKLKCRSSKTRTIDQRFQQQPSRVYIYICTNTHSRIQSLRTAAIRTPRESTRRQSIF